MDNRLKDSLHNKVSDMDFPTHSNIEAIIMNKKKKRRNYFAVITPIFATATLLLLLFGNLIPTHEPVYVENDVKNTVPNETLIYKESDTIKWNNEIYVTNGETIEYSKVGRKVGNILSTNDRENLDNSESISLEVGTPIYTLKDNSGLAILINDKWIVYKK